MPKLRKIILGTGVVVFIIFLFLNFLRFQQTHTSLDAGPFIAANPFDLSQVQSISQFRSCEGHNYSGKNAQGVEETYRTMKHYIEPIPKLAHSAGQVRIFAPFDGKVSRLDPDRRGSNIHLSPNSSNWNFIFFHIDLLPDLKNGSNLTAGQHIGYANLNGGANFDIALRYFGFGPQLNDSPFLYMTDALLTDYANAGITLDNIIVSKDEREADPCELAPGESGRDAFYAQSESGKSWIPVRRSGSNP